MAKGTPPNRKYTVRNNVNRLSRNLNAYGPGPNRIVRPGGGLVEGGTAAYGVARLAAAGFKSATKAIRNQNKAADTYKSVDPARSRAAKKAAETRRKNEKARMDAAKRSSAKKGAAAGAAMGAAAGSTGVIGATASNRKKSTKKTAGRSEPPNRTYSSRNKANAKKRKK